MGRFSADQNDTIWAYESGTYASKSGNLLSFGLVQSANPNAIVNKNPIRTQGDSTRNINTFTKGLKSYTADISYYPQDWRMLYMALGQVVDTGSVSPYTHTITELNTASGNGVTSGALCPFTSFSTLFQAKACDGNVFVREAKGCNINTFTITANNDGMPISCDINLIAQDMPYSAGSLTTASGISTESPYIFSDLRMDVPSGTQVLGLKTATFTVNNGLDGRQYLDGTRNISPPVPQERNYELNLTVDATSEQLPTFYNSYFEAGSEFNCGMFLQAGSNTRQVYISMSGCVVTNMSDPLNLVGTNEETITIQPKSVNAVARDELSKYKAF